MSARVIARPLVDMHRVPPWWSQMVAVVYERIRGLCAGACAALRGVQDGWTLVHERPAVRRSRKLRRGEPAGTRGIRLGCARTQGRSDILVWTGLGATIRSDNGSVAA